MGGRDRRLAVNAFGSRERPSAKLARAGEISSVPAQQPPGCLYLGTRDHARPLADVGPEISGLQVDVSITLKPAGTRSCGPLGSVAWFRVAVRSQRCGPPAPWARR